MVAGVSMRSYKLTPVIVRPAVEVDKADEAQSTTPTAKGARIAERLPCPKAPRKRRSEMWSYNGGGSVREYFAVPNLESVFVMRRVESAN